MGPTFMELINHPIVWKVSIPVGVGIGVLVGGLAACCRRRIPAPNRLWKFVLEAAPGVASIFISLGLTKAQDFKKWIGFLSSVIYGSATAGFIGYPPFGLAVTELFFALQASYMVFGFIALGGILPVTILTVAARSYYMETIEGAEGPVTWVVNRIQCCTCNWLINILEGRRVVKACLCCLTKADPPKEDARLENSVHIDVDMTPKPEDAKNGDTEGAKNGDTEPTLKALDDQTNDNQTLDQKKEDKVIEPEKNANNSHKEEERLTHTTT